MSSSSRRWLVAAAWFICLVVVLGRFSDRSAQALVYAAWFIFLGAAPIVLCQRALKENPKHSRTWLGIILGLIAIILWMIILTGILMFVLSKLAAS